MDGLLDKLYSYEYFSLYLIIAIVVLVVLFLIVLFYGRKDQKKREIEATTKLNKINEEANTFKEETPINPVEVNPNVLENETMVVPTLDSFGENQVNMGETPIINTPVENTITEPQMEAPVINNVEAPQVPEQNPIPNEVTFASINPEPTPVAPEVTPVMEEVKVEPVVNEEKMDFAPLFANEEKPLNVEPTEEPSVPEFNYNEVVNNIANTQEPKEVPKDVFSSVFVDNTPSNEEGIDLPILKKNDEPSSSLDINNLTGETYTINK